MEAEAGAGGGLFIHLSDGGGEGCRRYWKCLSIKTCQQGLNYRSPNEKCEGLDGRVACRSILTAFTASTIRADRWRPAESQMDCVPVKQCTKTG